LKRLKRITNIKKVVMRKIKVLIITSGEDVSPVFVKFIAEMLISLKLSAYFSYLKNTEEALEKKEKITKAAYYDLICLASDWPSIQLDNILKIFDFIDTATFYPDSKFSFLAYLTPFIKLKNKSEEFGFYFLNNKKSFLADNKIEALSDYLFSRRPLTLELL
jgi:hypothetical protein